MWSFIVRSLLSLARITEIKNKVMANFKLALSKVLDVEGGYQAIPEDRGNYNSFNQLVGTNRGINAQVYEDWIGRPPSIDDMKAISAVIATAIYKARYWDRMKGDLIQNHDVAEIIFDGHVNHGSWGIKMLQEVLNVKKDSIVGPKTLAAINAADPAWLYNTYKERRERFYVWFASNVAGQHVFLNGWLNRLKTFSAFGQSTLAGGAILIGLVGWLIFTN